MSIPVPVDRLAEQLRDRPVGYLLTADTEGRVKAVTVEPTLADGALLCSHSRGTAANLARNPVATLLFPPTEHHGYTLLVDGEAEAGEDGIVVRPGSAVLHRPATHADGPVAADGCGHDCAPVT
jgi:hypothetical protein